ncbi:MAG TPA: hypothetical protein VKJ01_02490 [Candidatus Solibacter sp.]|nr:hypothetical protein [Candidatus Solibacter sp.]
MIVIAAHDRRRHAGAGNLGQRVANHALRVGRRSRRIENVSSQQHTVDALAFGDIHDLGGHLFLLRKPRASNQGLADMPIGGMQEPHRVEPRDPVHV